MAKIAPYAKAITAALITFLTAIAVALAQDGISAQEWITAAIALLVALGAVWRIPNAKDTSEDPPQ